MAHRQRDDEAPAIVGIDGEQRRGRARGRKRGAVVCATGRLTVRARGAAVARRAGSAGRRDASASATASSQSAPARSIRSMTQGHLDRDGRVRDALYRTRRARQPYPAFQQADAPRGKSGARHSRGQLGLNQVNAVEAARGRRAAQPRAPVAHLRTASQPGLRRSLRPGAAAPRPARHRRPPGRGPVVGHGAPRSPGRSANASTVTTCRPMSASTPTAGRSRRRPASTRRPPGRRSGSRRSEWNRAPDALRRAR